MRKKYRIGFALVSLIAMFCIRSYFKEPGNRSDNDVFLYAKSKMEKYCSPSYLDFLKPMYFSSGPAENIKIHSVAILVRHGDRSPINSWRTYFTKSKHKFCKTIDKELVSKASSLRAIFLNSVPNSLKNYSWFPNKDECSSAQLTSKGADQLFKLGKVFSSKYTELFDYVILSGRKRLWNLASKNVKGDGGFIYLRTTEYERTFQSGMAFLAGFFAEFIENFLEVMAMDAFHIKDLDMGEFLKNIVTITSTQSVWQCTHHKYSSHGMEPPSCFCQKADMIMKQNDLQNYNSIEMEILEKGRSSVKSFYGSSTSFGAAAESIASYICHGADLPCFPSTLGENGTLACMPWSDVSNILAAIEIIERANYGGPKTKLLDKLRIYPLLWEIWYKFSLFTIYERNGDPKKPSFLIYPSHDSTILAFLQVLGLDRNLWWPAFSSSITIELHSLREKQFFIKVFHDGVDVTNLLPFCRDRFTIEKHLCHFENLSFYVLKQLRSTFNGDAYEEFCEL